jgi:hypothetical protein
MTIDLLINWLPTLIAALFAGGIFAGRRWIEARIEARIKHEFDGKLATITAELRKNEALFASELRSRETEIGTLRESVLSGRANRPALLDKRRFEAIEKIWTAVNNLAHLRPLSSMMALLNFKVMAKEASDPRMQLFLSTIGVVAPDDEKLKDVARDEQPFLPELVWAYFLAYKTILLGSLLRFKILKTGLDEADKYLSAEQAKTILKAALPHQSSFIDDQEPESYYYLLDEVQALLLAELRKVLDGKAADDADAERARAITDALKTVETERAARAVSDVAQDPF